MPVAKSIITYVSFAPITDVVGHDQDDQLIECEPYGRLIGLKLERIEGEENAADTPTFRVRGYANTNQDPDYIVFDASFDGATIDEDNPLWYDRSSLDVKYQSENVHSGIAGTPQMWFIIESAGLNNAVVAPFLFRLRIETLREE